MQEIDMKRAALIAALVVSLGTGSAAMADPHGRRHDNHHAAAHGRHETHWSHRDAHRYRPGPPRAVHRAPRFRAYHRPHGYRAHRWVRGERLPVAYYARPYVIADYRTCGLRVPPRGYHWVRVDGDAVLAAVATGIVLDTVFHVFD
jgi:Ni/Co efflux regulator RcnB